MLALDQLQATMMQALDHGPDFLPDDMFAGSRERVLAGMKVHANTISHARLVALEDTFPRTRQWLGHDRFNAHSRLYSEQPGVTALTLARIGAYFPGHLARRGEGGAAVDIARFEWLWLESYHAAEAQWLRLADLAGIEPQVLMGIEVAAHPAASLDRFDPAAGRLIGEEVPGVADANGILITRPEAQVLVSPASAAMRALFRACDVPVTIGNLLAGPNEPGSMDRMPAHDFMPALVALLEAGALIRVIEQRV
jgi:hypothetical protein